MPIQWTHVIDKKKFSMAGDSLEARFEVASVDELSTEVARIYYWFPVYLNLVIGDPPAIESVIVQVDDAAAFWIPDNAANTIFLTTLETQADTTRRALERCYQPELADERRLLVALEYFYAAARLNALGETPGEFLAEAILNYAKILEVLFPASPSKSATAARKGLGELGYSAVEIEEKFIPCLYLRNELGIGHPRISLLEADELEVVHSFSDHAEASFRDLLAKIMTLPQESRGFLRAPSARNADFGKLIDRLKAVHEKRGKEGVSVKTTESPTPIEPISKY